MIGHLILELHRRALKLYHFKKRILFASLFEYNPELKRCLP
jgi:hypothetical protein